jgi:hypothetical protein
MTTVVSLSSTGPLLDVQKDATLTSKIYWRMAGTAVLLLPFAALDAYNDGVVCHYISDNVCRMLDDFMLSNICHGRESDL